ncbi:MAG: hypothetical protein AAGE52_32700 [Myxococcota bacterium]
MEINAMEINALTSRCVDALARTPEEAKNELEEAMGKFAFVVRDIQPPQGRGKIAHALTNALVFNEAGHEATILFEGQGVEWLALFEVREDKFTQHYGARFDQAREAGLLGGACNFCASVRFKVADSAERLGVPLYGEEGEHGSLLPFLEDGFQILSI